MLSLELLGALLVSLSTLMIFSFLYKDNPFYKFAEHVFVGVSAGYGVAMVWFQVLKPNLVDRLWIPTSVLKQRMFEAGELSPAQFADYTPVFGDQVHYAQGIFMVFLVLGVMMLFKISSRLNWVSRWPLAYVIGAFAGIQVIQATQGSLVPQLQATMKDFSGRPVVQEMLESTPQLPAAEMDARETRLREWLVSWYGDTTGTRYSRRLVDELLGDVRETELFRTRPRDVFVQLPLKLEGLQALEEEREVWLSASEGGLSTRQAIASAVLRARGVTPDSLALAARATNADSLAAGFTLAAADSLELLPWQERRLTLLFRISQENLRAEKQLTALLESNGLDTAMAASAAARLSRPPGRDPLIRLLKEEGFAPGRETLDWEHSETIQLVDSLMGGVNTRADHLKDWTPAQVADLETRLEGSGGLESLSTELHLRLGAFDALLLGGYQVPDERRAALRTVVLEHWVKQLVQEAEALRRTELVEAVLAFCQPGLLTSFSDAELTAFRADPVGVPPLVEGLAPGDEPGSATRFGRASQAVAGWVGLDLTASADSLRLRILLDILSNLLVLVGVCTGVFYFFFSKKQEGGLGVASKIGIAFLMMSFGASFGYTVMGRISLAIGRMQDLLVVPRVAGICLLLLVAALVIQARFGRDGKARG
jgi:uncharacterized membrane protein